MRVHAASGRHLGGWRPQKADHRDKFLAVAPSVDIPPKALLDWHVPIFDQGHIGSCTANAGCAAVAYLDRLDDGNARVWSRLFLYAMTRHVEGTPIAEDAGAEIRDVFKALGQFGVCEERLWPYGHGQAFNASPNVEAVANAKKHEATFYYRCPTVRTIKASIAQGFPVEFGTSIFERFFDAPGGEVPYPELNEKLEGGHALLIVGYDDEKQAVKFVNSWGTGWGDNGFGWLPYRYFNDGLATDCWTLRRIEL